MADFNELLKGFPHFHDKYYCGDNALMPALMKDGQAPDYFIISCIDSRSDPGAVFNAPPGTFFCHRAMGAIIRPYHKGTALAAALQFAIQHNKVSKVIILGHTGCGAIKALVDQIDDEEISSFVTVAKEGLEKAQECHTGKHTQGKSLFRHAEEQIVLLSTENLKTYPSVKNALATNSIEIASWLFNMEEGAIYSYDSSAGEFIKIDMPD